MMCGSKCFIVEIDINGKRQVKKVTARTWVNARKVIRGKYGDNAEIVSVKKEKTDS